MLSFICSSKCEIITLTNKTQFDYFSYFVLIFLISEGEAHIRGHPVLDGSWGLFPKKDSL